MPMLIIKRVILRADDSCSDYLKALWAMDNGYPMLTQLWFVRNLIILALGAPVIYSLFWSASFSENFRMNRSMGSCATYRKKLDELKKAIIYLIVRYTRLIGVLIFGVAWMLHPGQAYPLSTLFFYSLGAWFSIISASGSPF